jgi:hypothetical protein
MKTFIKGSLADLKIWGLMFVLQFPSLRALYKYTPSKLVWLVPVYLIAVFCVYSVIFRWRSLAAARASILSNKWLTVGAVLALILVNFFIYPIADNLKLQGRGSDQDDALIVTGKNLASGKNPYEARTYFSGNPLSAGPGWVIFNLPFTLTGLYFLLVPAYLAALLVLFKRLTGGFYAGNLFLILCMSSLAFWETTVVGSDLFAVGALFTACICAVFYSLNKGVYKTLLVILMLGFAATSRIVFAYVIPLVALFSWRRSGFRGIQVIIAALLITVLLHLTFYSWNPSSYTPLHLFGKGSMLLPFWLKVLTMLFSILALSAAFVRVKPDIKSWLFYFWLCLAAPLFLVSLGDLITLRGLDLAQWEGANYLIVTLPIFLSYFILDQVRHE